MNYRYYWESKKGKFATTRDLFFFFLLTMSKFISSLALAHVLSFVSAEEETMVEKKPIEGKKKKKGESCDYQQDDLLYEKVSSDNIMVRGK